MEQPKQGVLFGGKIGLPMEPQSGRRAGKGNIAVVGIYSHWHEDVNELDARDRPGCFPGLLGWVVFTAARKT